MTKIVSAEVFLIEAAFVTPYKLSYGARTTTRAVMLKLIDEDGQVGWGEADPYQPFTAESPDESARVLREKLLPALLGCACPEAGLVDALLDSIQTDHLCAKGAVTTALLDIFGRRTGVAIASLMGGALRSSLAVLWPLSNGTAEEDMPVIDARASEGFSTFMLKMGTSPIASEIRRVELLEARYGEKIAFIADANQGWSREEATQFLNGVRGSRLAFVEQPVPKEDLEGMAMLSKFSTHPLSADEPVDSLAVAAHIARMNAASILSVKSSKNGGPLRAQEIATVAKAFGMRCYMNSMLEFGITQAASLQHAVTITNLVDVGHAFMSTLRLAEDPTDFSTYVRGGTVHLPSGPGLGIQVDEAHVRRLTTEGFLLKTADALSGAAKLS